MVEKKMDPKGGKNEKGGPKAKRWALTAVKAAAIFLAALIVLAFAGGNILKFALYPDYYAAKTNVCINPGLNDGFVCQGVCEYEAEEKLFVCGYMKDKSASRIYVTDTDNDSYYVSLSLDGKDFTGHSGGIATHGDEVYVVCSAIIHVIPLQSLLEAESGDRVEIERRISIDNVGSSAYCDGEYLYVGEFYDGEKYFTHHSFDTPAGEYCAVICRYGLDDLSAPDKIYAIRDRVQGICFTPGGKVVLSTSYGITDSRYYVYDESAAADSGISLYGAPVYFLLDAEREIKGPAMAEGLDYYKGQIITLSESASDKYIFGKFFFANKIVSLDIAGA